MLHTRSHAQLRPQTCEVKREDPLSTFENNIRKKHLPKKIVGRSCEGDHLKVPDFRDRGPKLSKLCDTVLFSIFRGKLCFLSSI